MGSYHGVYLSNRIAKYKSRSANRSLWKWVQEGCPEPCFACKGDHSYLHCQTKEAEVRTRQQRATWHGGSKLSIATAVHTPGRKGTSWKRQPYDPQFDPPTPRKEARLKSKLAATRTADSLVFLLQKSDEVLADTLHGLNLLSKPGPCVKCGEEAQAAAQTGRPVWLYHILSILLNTIYFLSDWIKLRLSIIESKYILSDWIKICFSLVGVKLIFCLAGSNYDSL